MVVDIFGLFVIRKGEENPKYEEITIPGELKHWSHSITNILGLLPDQDACDRFSFEMAKGRCETPPNALPRYPNSTKKRRAPAESSHTRALGAWATMNKNRKRPSKLERGPHAWIAYNIRFILAGDLASAWETFGGVAMQLTHLGTSPNLAIAENATIAITYDAKVRTYANELSKFRTREKETTNLLKEEGRRVKRIVLRECGSTATFSPRNADVKRKIKDKWKGQDKGHKGKGRKGKGRNKFRGKTTGDRTPTGIKTTIGTIAPRTIGATTNLQMGMLMVVRPPRRPTARKLRTPTNLRRRNRRNSND